MRFPVVAHKDRNSGYGVTVPDLPGCFSAGDTLDGASDSTHAAILCHLEELLMDNETHRGARWDLGRYTSRQDARTLYEFGLGSP